MFYGVSWVLFIYKIQTIKITFHFSVNKLQQNGISHDRRGSSRCGSRRKSDNSYLPNNTTITPVPGAAIFAPHSSIGLSAVVVDLIDTSLSRLAESSSNSELSDKETEQKVIPVPSPETIGSARVSRKDAVKAVTAISVSNCNSNGHVASDSVGTPTKVYYCYV